MSEAAAQDRLTLDELAELARQMGSVVESALPLPAGLRALSDELPAGSARRVLRQLAQRTERGEPIDAALDSVGQRLPASLRGLIVVGLRTGQLPLVLEQYIDGARRSRDLTRRIWSAIAYPLLLLVLVTAVFLVLFGFIVPQFRVLYEDFEITLPLLTLAVLWTAPLIEWATKVGVGALAVAGGLLFVFRRTSLGGRLQRRVPLFGRLWCWLALAQWYRLLALMTEQQVPAALAARLLAQSTDDPVLRRGSAWLAERIARGEPLSAPLIERADLWGRTGPLVRWAEERSQVPESLAALAGMLERRCLQHAAFLRATAPTVLFLLVVFMVGALVLALVLPLFELLRGLAGG